MCVLFLHHLLISKYQEGNYGLFEVWNGWKVLGLSIFYIPSIIQQHLPESRKLLKTETIKYLLYMPGDCLPVCCTNSCWIKSLKSKKKRTGWIPSLDLISKSQWNIKTNLSFLQQSFGWFLCEPVQQHVRSPHPTVDGSLWAQQESSLLPSIAFSWRPTCRCCCWSILITISLLD